jgi:HAD superfamily hydrolase (TIGR01509 family)
MVEFDLVCFDFWWTLVTDRSPGGGRHEYRVEAFCNALASSGQSPDPADVDRVMRLEWAKYNEVHLEERRTPTNEERIVWMSDKLGLEPPSGDALTTLDQALEESLFVAPPQVLPGMRELLHQLSRDVHLAIISDTSYSGGATIRRLLAQAGVLSVFDVTTFSGEAGHAKPDPRVFYQTLGRLGIEPSRSVHIGDREATDIVGAKGIGMTAVLFLGAKPEPLKEWPQETQADHVAYNIKDLADLLGVY